MKLDLGLILIVLVKLSFALDCLNTSGSNYCGNTEFYLPQTNMISTAQDLDQFIEGVFIAQTIKPLDNSTVLSNGDVCSMLVKSIQGCYKQRGLDDACLNMSNITELQQEQHNEGPPLMNTITDVCRFFQTETGAFTQGAMTSGANRMQSDTWVKCLAIITSILLIL